MDAFLSALLSGILQVVVFAFIPFVVWLLTRRKTEGFLRYLGLFKAPPAVLVLALALALLNLGIGFNEALLEMLRSEGTASGRFVGQELGAVLLGVVLLEAWVKTGLSEEIFFRGFVGRRLIAWLGFQRGNAIQAVIFGLIHMPIILILPEEARTGGLVMFIVGIPTVMGWLMGWLNERKAEGSILPGYVLHAAGNTVAYLTPLWWT